MRMAIVLPNWIGDVAMATPTLRALRERWPEGYLVGVMRPYVRHVLSGTNWLDEAVYYDRKSRDPGERFWGVVRKLRAGRLDAIVLLTNSLRAGALAWLSGARERIGYARNGRGLLLTQAPRPPRAEGKLLPVSAVDYYFHLAERLGAAPAPPRLQLSTLPADEARAETIWQELGLGMNVVGLNTGGAYGPAKTWPPEYAAELARRILREEGAEVLVLCGPAEAETAAAIEREAGNPGIRSLAAHETSIGELKAIIRRLRLLVSTDSGPRHLAAGLGVPTVSLMGPIDPRWSENYNPRSPVLAVELDCRPCGKRVCPLGHHRCMRDLTVDRVLSAVRAGLSPGAVPAAA